MSYNIVSIYYPYLASEQGSTFRGAPGRTGIVVAFSRCYDSDVKGLHRLVCLNTWSPDSFLFLEVPGPLEGGAQLEDINI